MPYRLLTFKDRPDGVRRLMFKKHQLTRYVVTMYSKTSDKRSFIR